MKKKIKTALISISDKKNLIPLLNILKLNKIKIISSGGTYKEIKRLKYKCIEVSEFTNSKEILDGRVKTLHPKIHAGILNERGKKSHLKEIANHNFENIDLVIVNFYPFENTLKKTKNHKKIVENIDIGGPTMVRAAAKNYNDVTVITSSDQYEELIQELNKHKGSTSLNFREKLSRIAFAETAYYDSVISSYFNKKTNTTFPEKKVFHGNLIEQLRYGENPHQLSAIYSSDSNINLKKIHGKQLSYNNYNDIFSALTISRSLPKGKGTVIVKHANPCGVSIKSNNLESYKSALLCDPVSAFGGIVAFNFKITKTLAEKLNQLFLEVIIANGFDNSAIKILKTKKNLRLIDGTNYTTKEVLKVVSFNQGLLLQSEDLNLFSKENFKIVSKKKPTSQQLKDLIFAFNVCRFVKSNAIVLASDETTVGIGSGQTSRLDSCQIAINKMKQFNLQNNSLVAASDAFFPFVDGIEKLVQSGVRAIVQPSGSIKDREIINYANQTDTVLLFSKTRHFRH
ncbi:bifunctional phosphoribosylaminoimidazolecarboxamide formyltransferase/IMP cyclohydrolase [Candidatus Pelagibacter sp.]|nr:bifunctional phosphoribosylaminoimidazolecarboxamide formyltransferase/IMP cyclohydrolase [Candidatus Pelagibacter sp.]